MRPGCYNCPRKHLAQAQILMTEAEQGYPTHRWLAIGHMAEASDEIRAFSVTISDRIRGDRKDYEAVAGFRVPILDLIDLITELEEIDTREESVSEQS